MVPLTNATIAYIVGDILEVVDAPTLIVNRELAAWYREAETTPSARTAVRASATPTVTELGTWLASR